ncbi:hypothetical protein SAMD00023353_2101220 [Rosellinia necatrix]|uniref:Uncharacterized protein n=1 Tax=Rosellinia necatrix TaxID=77044 RepID=A0A1S8A7N8_ROSNE|nr:hypothetical protein SAMD00023353_2101220 [Rosellinia necatrix]
MKAQVLGNVRLTGDRQSRDLSAGRTHIRTQTLNTENRNLGPHKRNTYDTQDLYEQKRP